MSNHRASREDRPVWEANLNRECGLVVFRPLNSDKFLQLAMIDFSSTQPRDLMNDFEFARNGKIAQAACANGISHLVHCQMRFVRCGDQFFTFSFVWLGDNSNRKL